MRHRLYLVPFFLHKKTYRFSHLYFLIAGACFAFVLPKWLTLTERLSPKQPSLDFYTPSISNIANSITTRTLMSLYIPIVAWVSGHSRWHLLPFVGFAVLGFISLPSVLASFLIYREFTASSIVHSPMNAKQSPDTPPGVKHPKVGLSSQSSGNPRQSQSSDQQEFQQFQTKKKLANPSSQHQKKKR